MNYHSLISLQFNCFVFITWCFVNVIIAQNSSPQVLVIEPSNQTAVLGEQTVLACRVINKAGTIQWTRDGFGLGIEKNLNGFPRYTMIGNELEGDYSLAINPVTLEDDAFFQCQVTASSGVPGIRSRSAFLTVYVAPDPPVIVQARASGDILRTTAGTVIELTCESHGGKPASELQWVYSEGTAIISKNITSNSQLLNDGKRVNTESKWTFVAGKEYDNKTIICRSENSALKEPLTAAIRLDVKYAPEVQLRVVEPLGQIRVGDNVVFLCEANANPINQLLYKWFKNDEIIIGDYDTKLILTGVERLMNSAVIACEASNSVGQSRATHTLDIAFGPILKTAEDQVFGTDSGGDVRLNCEVEGNPKPDITWLKLGETDVLSKDLEFVVKDITEEKVGKYICRASVKGFPEISLQQIVAINRPPHILDPYPQFGIRGETIRISCYFEAVPKPNQILWYHNRQTLGVDSSRGVDIIYDRIPGESTQRSTLVIHNSKLSDFGEYNCSVWNQYGFDSKIIIMEETMSFTFLVAIVSSLLSMLALIVFITISTILCLRHKHRKRLKHRKKSNTSLSSTQTTDSGQGSTDSDSSDGESDSKSNGVEMQSIISSHEEVVRKHNIRNINHNNNQHFYSNEILFDFNQSFKQYL